MLVDDGMVKGDVRHGRAGIEAVGNPYRPCQLVYFGHVMLWHEDTI